MITTEQINKEINRRIEYLNGVNFKLFSEGEEYDYDYPFGFYVDKYGYYEQGNVMEIKDGVATLFLTGEHYGELKSVSISDLDMDNIIKLYDWVVDEIKLNNSIA